MSVAFKRQQQPPLARAPSKQRSGLEVEKYYGGINKAITPPPYSKSTSSSSLIVAPPHPVLQDPSPRSILSSSENSSRSSTPKKKVRFSFDATPADDFNTIPLDNISAARNESSNAAVKVPKSGHPLKKAITSSGIPTRKIPPPVRPSLSEQLSGIAMKASEITASLRNRGNKVSPLMTASSTSSAILTIPSVCHSVGNLTSKFPSTCSYYSDHLEFLFYHPHESAEIRMVIWYRDMATTALLSSPPRFRFRVPRRLVHFSLDYDPSKHFIVLTLPSSLASSQIKDVVMPLLPAQSCK